LPRQSDFELFGFLLLALEFLASDHGVLANIGTNLLQRRRVGRIEPFGSKF